MTDEPVRMSGTNPWVTRYRKAGSLMLTLFLLFMCLNFVVVGVDYLGTLLRKSGPTRKYGKERVRSVHPDIAQDDLSAFMAESYERGFRYAPLLTFREKPFQGRWVNTSEVGFRHGASEPPWPPDPEAYTIFLFGGSTTFGYGVADQHTVPAYLQTALDKLAPDLNACVYNFGQGSYFSSMERLFFEGLLLEGHAPDLAIFIDGLNDFHWYDGVPPYSPDMNALFQRASRAQPYNEYSWNWIPLIKLLVKLKKRWDTPPKQSLPLYDDKEILNSVWERYLRNTQLTQAAAESFGGSAAFVFQPVPTYNYDLSFHAMTDDDNFGQHNFSKLGYPLVKPKFLEQGENYIWCGDLQETQEQNLYVDAIHYNPEFSELFAEEIAGQLIQRKLIPKKTL